MKLRYQFQLYIVVIHLAGLGIAAVFHEHLGLWFFLIEFCLLLSAWLGLRLVNTTLKPLEFVQSFKDLLKEHEFATRFSQVGQAEMDQLIATYNLMLRELYDERLRLGDQRGFLELFMQETPVGVLITDYDQQIRIANPAAARFLESSVENLQGKRFSQLATILARHIDRLPSASAELVSLQGARRLRIQRQSFADRGFEREFVLIEELTAVLNDSERAAYEKLIRLMSHEVNNTVGSTNSLLESCLNYTPQISESDQDDYAQALKVVITRNEHLNRFMRDFAQVVKLPKPDRRPTDLADLLKHLETVHQGQFAERRIIWNAQIAADLPPVNMDREQIEQALINVIKNAMEAIGTDGLIEARAWIDDGRVRLEIIDNGDGLDADNLSELFTPFFSSKAAGQGLGLTLVKEILLRHGFDFDLVTKSDGRTCFTIRF